MYEHTHRLTKQSISVPSYNSSSYLRYTEEYEHTQPETCCVLSLSFYVSSTDVDSLSMVMGIGVLARVGLSRAMPPPQARLFMATPRGVSLLVSAPCNKLLLSAGNLHCCYWREHSRPQLDKTGKNGGSRLPGERVGIIYRSGAKWSFDYAIAF